MFDSIFFGVNQYWSWSDLPIFGISFVAAACNALTGKFAACADRVNQCYSSPIAVYSGFSMSAILLSYFAALAGIALFSWTRSLVLMVSIGFCLAFSLSLLIRGSGFFHFETIPKISATHNPSRAIFVSLITGIFAISADTSILTVAVLVGCLGKPISVFLGSCFGFSFIANLVVLSPRFRSHNFSMQFFCRVSALIYIGFLTRLISLVVQEIFCPGQLMKQLRGG